MKTVGIDAALERIPFRLAGCCQDGGEGKQGGGLIDCRGGAFQQGVPEFAVLGEFNPPHELQFPAGRDQLVDAAIQILDRLRLYQMLEFCLRLVAVVVDQ